jgi:predicted transcriptional regulator
MTEATTIKVHQDTKILLDTFREYRNESYDEVIRKVTLIARQCAKEPELGKDAVRRIDAARARIKSGRFVTEQEARRRLGL